MITSIHHPEARLWKRTTTGLGARSGVTSAFEDYSTGPRDEIETTTATQNQIPFKTMDQFVFGCFRMRR